MGDAAMKIERGARRRICAGLLRGWDNERVATATGYSARTADILRRELNGRGIATDGSAILSVEQAAFVLGVIARRVRELCSPQQSPDKPPRPARLGRRVGRRAFVIEAAELADFLERDHPIGQSGRAAAAIDAEQRAERYGESQTAVA